MVESETISDQKSIIDKDIKNSGNEKHLTSLAPEIDIKTENNHNIANYFRHLDEGLENPSNHNIAITGKYGSGKSTIIDNYLNQRNKNDFLRVSLATFSLNTDRKDKNIDDENSELEHSIINQILYQINSKYIPLTNFKIKRPITFKIRVFFLIEILNIILVAGTKLKFIDIINKFWVGVLLFSLTAFLLINAWVFLKHVQFRNLKISFKNIDANLVDLNDNDNLFEKYIDEIIYIFQSSGKKVLIVEDIDRFNNIKIFQQLRELNIKLNNNGIKITKNKQKNWTFVYLVKDNIFAGSTDRVKFFDLIIPVIPYITTSNSALKLKKLFSNINIDDRLFDILGSYIDDYRLLKNTYNEFLVFQENLGNKDFNQLLALVAYKNVSPKYFDEFQNGRGHFGIILSKFKNDILTKQDELLTEKNQLEKKHSEAIAESEKELLMILFIRSGITSVPSPYGYTHVDIMHHVDLFINGSSYELTINEDRREWTYNELIDSDFYKFSIHNASGEEQYLNRLSQLNEKIKLNSNPRFKDIPRQLWDENQINDELLFALVKNGYIDEHYLDIINHSYGSSQNEIFKRNVYSEGKENVTQLELTAINQLVRILSLSDFYKPQILNFHLLHYLIENDYKDKLDAMLYSAMNSTDNFLEEYLNRYPNDFEKVKELSKDTLTLDLSKLVDNFNFKSILQNNFYHNNDRNQKIALDFFSARNLSNEEMNEYLSGDIYSSLKTLLIKNIIKPVNIADIASAELIGQYLDFDKILLSIKNINACLIYLNSDQNNSQQLTTSFVGFINKNIDNIVFDENLYKELYDLIVQSKDTKYKVINIIFKHYPKIYSKYNVNSFNDMSLQNAKILVKFQLFEQTWNVLKKMEKLSIPLKDIFSNKEIVYLYSDNQATILSISLLNSVAQTESGPEAFDLFAKSISNFQVNEKKLIDVFNNFYKNNKKSDISKFAKILTAYQDDHKPMLSYKFANTDANKSILKWFYDNGIIPALNLDNNDKLTIK
ncbi:hypothetical protein AAHN95_10850 [Leuconostoc mesenteroides]|uniref:YobI family P-loop NTPase n=3 Tax=Leuconostoc mesenteroides TaxID=1245 RepID=UPI000A2054DD|nr:hypothetical protein [Leuconostoc mesenteroides]ARN63520.1 hypothetical protein A0F18_05580 [Leuconostoc mesenteroides subsp. mesenteroides]MDV8928632.1 hypothetical protein [Leuconostoc mesenteroides]